jgi:hypothetical protein
MRRIRLLFWILLAVLVRTVYALENSAPTSFQATAGLEPIEFGFRYDDNVYRSILPNGRFEDEIYLVNLGANLGVKYDVFKGNLNYQLGADQYQLYSSLNNVKNDFDLFLSANPDQFSLYFKREYYFRNSQDFNFNYIDDDYLFGVVWAPVGPWNYEARYKNFARQYYDNDPSVRSRNFIDEGIHLGVQREIDDKFSVKLEGDYNDRQFERYIIESDGVTPSESVTQHDQTWTILLNAHLYFENVLQDINFEAQRTNSNSYGFSNNVESVSWAGVVRPVSTLYLQLFFRLYFKNYDVTPLTNPDLQVGFVDEDSQDLLSIRTTWEWSPQWAASLGVSRVRNESTQPGVYYFKNILSAQIKRSF